LVGGRAHALLFFTGVKVCGANGDKKAAPFLNERKHRRNVPWHANRKNSREDSRPASFLARAVKGFRWTWQGYGGGKKKVGGSGLLGKEGWRISLKAPNGRGDLRGGTLGGKETGQQDHSVVVEGSAGQKKECRFGNSKSPKLFD